MYCFVAICLRWIGVLREPCSLSRIPTNLMIFFDFGVIENQDSALPVGMKALIGSLSEN